jgi:hypothetical protein
VSKRGPYVEWDDGTEVYFPISDYTLNEARHEASLHAAETISAWGRSRYIGKRDIALHDHDQMTDDECPIEPVWVFETYEGTYR